MHKIEVSDEELKALEEWNDEKKGEAADEEDYLKAQKHKLRAEELSKLCVESSKEKANPLLSHQTVTFHGTVGPPLVVERLVSGSIKFSLISESMVLSLDKCKTLSDWLRGGA